MCRLGPELHAKFSPATCARVRGATSRCPTDRQCALRKGPGVVGPSSPSAITAPRRRHLASRPPMKAVNASDIHPRLPDRNGRALQLRANGVCELESSSRQGCSLPRWDAPIAACARPPTAALRSPHLEWAELVEQQAPASLTRARIWSRLARVEWPESPVAERAAHLGAPRETTRARPERRARAEARGASEPLARAVLVRAAAPGMAETVALAARVVAAGPLAQLREPVASRGEEERAAPRVPAPAAPRVAEAPAAAVRVARRQL